MLLLKNEGTDVLRVEGLTLRKTGEDVSAR